MRSGLQHSRAQQAAAACQTHTAPDISSHANVLASRDPEKSNGGRYGTGNARIRRVIAAMAAVICASSCSVVERAISGLAGLPDPQAADDAEASAHVLWCCAKRAMKTKEFLAAARECGTNSDPGVTFVPHRYSRSFHFEYSRATEKRDDNDPYLSCMNASPLHVVNAFCSSEQRAFEQKMENCEYTGEFNYEMKTSECKNCGRRSSHGICDDYAQLGIDQNCE